MRQVLILITLLLLTGTLHAQDSADSHFETPIPIADRYDIARRFSGIDVAAHTPEALNRDYAVGDRESFIVINSATSQRLDVAAEVLAISAGAVIWGERDTGLTREGAQRFAEAFDRRVAQPAHQLWGTQAFAGIDGDPRTHLLFTRKISSRLAGYFTTANTLPRALAPTSNERDLLIFNSDNAPFILPNTLATAAHEFQHMLRAIIDKDEAGWVDEGYSMLTEHLLGWPDNQWALNAFFAAPQTQLTSWGTDANISAEYGAALAFLLYFYERFGEDALRVHSEQAANGMAGFEATMQALNLGDAATFHADWVLANWLRDPATGYGYQTLPDDLVRTPPLRSVMDLPAEATASLAQYGAHYYEVTNPPPQMTFTLEMPQSAPLLPVAASSGRWFWYSQRGDEANPRLTRRFDLRDVRAPQLVWRVWYALEQDWDYAYVSISSDAGATWQIQSTALSTTRNPHSRSIGAGYTGNSGTWHTESLDLSAFAGQEILVRFEMLTDDSVNFTGIALDDVALLAAGYISDFEADDGGWQAEGWIRTTNEVPQQMWVQAVQHDADGVQVTRWLATGDATYTLENAPDVERVSLALAPFAPMTLQPITYQLVITP